MLPVLLGELAAETQALLTIVCTMSGGAITWVVTRVWDWRAARRKEALEDEERRRRVNIEDDDRTIERLEKLLEREEKLRIEMREDYRKLEQEFRVTERTAERAVAWIVHLESLLASAKIPHPKWKDVLNAGSTEHKPLGPTVTPTGGEKP